MAERPRRETSIARHEVLQRAASITGISKVKIKSVSLIGSAASGRSGEVEVYLYSGEKERFVFPEKFIQYMLNGDDEKKGGAPVSASHKIDATEIPMPMFPLDFNKELIAVDKAIALQCDTCGLVDCVDMHAVINRKEDNAIWQKVAAKQNQSKGQFVICVPFAKTILYPILVERRIVSDWLKREKAQFIVYGPHGETYFRNSEEGLLVDEKRKLLSLVAHRPWTDLPDDDIKAMCSSLCKSPSHNYGTSRKMLDMTIEKVGRVHESIRTLYLAISLYGMCTICYTNHTTALSVTFI